MLLFDQSLQQAEKMIDRYVPSIRSQRVISRGLAKIPLGISPSCHATYNNRSNVLRLPNFLEICGENLPVPKLSTGVVYLSPPG